MTITCKRCAYWKPPEEEERLGECRRNPPVHEFWPATYGTDWCGLAVPRGDGGAMAVVDAAQTLVRSWESGEGVPAAQVDALRDALERMKP
jgi:hypothetical protein